MPCDLILVKDPDDSETKTHGVIRYTCRENLAKPDSLAFLLENHTLLICHDC